MTRVVVGWGRVKAVFRGGWGECGIHTPPSFAPPPPAPVPQVGRAPIIPEDGN